MDNGQSIESTVQLCRNVNQTCAQSPQYQCCLGHQLLCVYDMPQKPESIGVCLKTCSKMGAICGGFTRDPQVCCEVLILSNLSLSLSKIHYSVSTVSLNAFKLGEGPHWDDSRQVLWFVDSNDYQVCQLNVSTKLSECHKFDDLISLVHPYDNGDDLLVTIRNKLLRFNWTSKEGYYVAQVAPQLNGKERFNDGKVDALGRLWIGTVLEGKSGVIKGKGNLYKWENGSFVKMSDGFYLTNGMTWSPDNKQMFINDSEDRKVYAFDFNLELGTISNKTILIDGNNSTDLTVNDYPDGLTIDRSGYLWIGSYSNGRVFRVDPQNGDVVDSVSIPCPLTTTPVFGGLNFDEMFVTTGYLNGDSDQRLKYPTCGQVYRIVALDSNQFVGDIMFTIKN
ncbi:regucalcin-like [Oppia nitens]|uniref:regucalcin-like n=1 Tax=Oppia nitens TaxID=1686743 RepID=UPI0023DC9FE1|nr:regucalcin-like [Oppia nitens]